MKKVSSEHPYTKKFIWITASLAVLFFSMLFVPPITRFKPGADDLFRVSLGDALIGDFASTEKAQECLNEARRIIGRERPGEMIYADAPLNVEGRSVLWGATISDRDAVERMTEVLREREEVALVHCYTVKIGEYTVNLADKDDVTELLSRTKGRFDPGEEYVVSLTQDDDREINVLTGQVRRVTEQRAIEERERELPTGGMEAQLADLFAFAEPAAGREFEDYVLGLTDLNFGTKIEVVESYLPANQILSLDAAVEEVTKDKEVSVIHEVRSGDTLSGIAYQYGLSLDELISMNSMLSDENSLIRPGDRLTVTVPRPELSVVFTMQEYYEEDYQADTIYKNNDSWYTNHQETIQQASPGHRRVIALVTYRDGQRESSEIVKQEITVAAVPRIVERGTKAPPTYIWPVSGGYVTSGFGRRNAPKAGASTYHQGVDIGVPIGTAVTASCGGVVTVAGWQGGYGNVVYIRHEDGRETRYGHLSRVQVSVGQTVRQGQRIALSGNTGNSTGPHLHFEIRIGGSAVNPLNYVTW